MISFIHAVKSTTIVIILNMRLIILKHNWNKKNINKNFVKNLMTFDE